MILKSGSAGSCTPQETCAAREDPIKRATGISPKENSLPPSLHARLTDPSTSNTEAEMHWQRRTVPLTAETSQNPSCRLVSACDHDRPQGHKASNLNAAGFSQLNPLDTCLYICCTTAHLIRAGV